jgi:hypothetical protein
MAENGFIPLTAPQVESVRKAIVEVANERTVEVLRDADLRYPQMQARGCRAEQSSNVWASPCSIVPA